ncbi:ABC transporter ATP-binding protein [Propionibacterium sp.]|uniref:ABC transporter ATP-binding protein n=1 Tax=Propionibacterium sp. TaxID=1977903 RepID=UPI0039ED49A6
MTDPVGRPDTANGAAAWGQVDIEGLGYCYPRSDRSTLNGATAQLVAGSFTVVMGRAGSGKSSLLMTLNGVIPQLLGGRLSGRILLDGADLAEHRVQAITRCVGLLQQDPEAQVLGRTVLEDVAFGPRNHQLPRAEILDRVRECLQLVSLNDMTDRVTSKLSGGELQRVALAGILAMKPQVICLDEPASQLDPAGRRQVYAAVDALRHQRHCTLVVAEHEPADVIGRADQLVVLDKGAVAWQGRPEDFFRDPTLVGTLGIKALPITRIFEPLVAHRLLSAEQMPLDVASAEAVLHTLSVVRGRDVRPPAPAQVALCNEVALCDETVQDRFPDSPPPDRALPGDQHVSRSPETVGIKGLRHVFSNGVIGLDGVDLHIEAGDFVALVGPNGAGKTTLVRHLNGLLRAAPGRVRVNGAEVADRPVHELAHQVGFVFQNPDHQIFCRTVAEEVGYGLRVAKIPHDEVRRRVGEVLELVGLAAVREDHPLVLSRGQRRLVAVASVLVLRPGILVLDEPTTGQDVPGTDALMTIVGRLNADGTTVIMVCHDMDLVAHHARRVVAMDKGRVVADGPTAEVLSDTSLWERGVLAPTQPVELCHRLWPGSPALLDEATLGRHLLAELLGKGP